MASKGPRSRMCHICGRQYVISSFEFHVKQCKKLFLQQQEKLPEGERRALPPDPGEDALLPPRHGGGGGGDDGGGGRATRRVWELLERGWLTLVLVLGVGVSAVSLATIVQGWLAHQQAVVCVDAEP